MKILIIGCNGFIGHHAYKYFLKDNSYSVFGSDIFNAYDKEHFQLLATHDEAFFELFSGRQFDCCINASGMANVAYSEQNPLADYTANVFNTIKILEAIRKNNPGCKYINLSSAAVYGNPKKMPVLEDEKTNPISIYGFHKLQSEIICREYYKIYNIASLNLRLFSVFGEGLKKQLFWDLYTKVKDNKNVISLYGKADNSRDYIYILDLMQVFEVVLSKADFDAGVMNVANGKEIDIKTAVKEFMLAYNCEKPFTFTSGDLPGYPSRWIADISKLKELGYKSKTSMKEGLKKYCKWLKDTE